MQNPLLSNNIITAIDKYTNEEVVVQFTDIGKYFKHIYCLCPFSLIESDIFSRPNVDPIEYNNYMKQMILYRTKITILKNLIHYGNIIYIKKEDIAISNHLKYDLDDEMILVLPFYNISFLNLQKYIDTVNGGNNLDSLYNLFVINNYFGEKINKQSNTLQITNIIKDLSEANYWKFDYNCHCNLTKLFNKRKFNFTSVKPSKDNIINFAISKLDTTIIKENYLEQIFKSSNYTDPSNIISKNGFSLYNVVKSKKYTNDNIIELFKQLDYCTFSKYLLFTQLAMSREYCHLVVNNHTILNQMMPTINNYIEVFEVVFGYAWLRFYFEESICKFYMKTTDSYIFDADTASCLPTFHFDHMNPNKNPYMPILVGYQVLNPACNVGGVINNSKSKRICSTNEFIERLNIFITNKKERNIFENINFDDYKMAITGSIMTACLQYNHPLLELYRTKDITMNDLYNRFYNEYYCNADIDTMILTNNMVEFLDLAKEFHQKLTQNILRMYDYSEPRHVNLQVNKSIFLFVTEDFIKHNIVTPHLDYNMVISCLTKQNIINLFLPFAEKLHTLEMNKLEGCIETLQLKHPEYFEFKPEYLVVKLYNQKIKGTMVKVKTNIDFSEDTIDKILESEEEEIISHVKQFTNTDGVNISISFKVKISTPHLDHDFEIFPIKKDDFMATVGQFHMPCVRAYYNGKKVFMTPSCISAHMTYMNIDYKYFAGSKDPIEIINKYRMRGFGTFLNKNEIITYLKYSSMVPFWNNLFNVDLNSKNIGNCLGPLPINHMLFYPRQYNMDYYTDSKLKPIPFDDPYVNITNPGIINRNDFYKSKYDIHAILSSNDIYNYIDSNTGYIKPIPMNIIDTISSIFVKDKSKKFYE